VEKKLETKGRRLSEEAKSDANIRNCPICKAKFIKIEGCNKVRCSCGVYICYICRKQIKNDHNHFCQEPYCQHQSCGQCGLYENVDDTEAMQQATLATNEQGRDGPKTTTWGSATTPHPTNTKQTQQYQPPHYPPLPSVDEYHYASGNTSYYKPDPTQQHTFPLSQLSPHLPPPVPLPNSTSGWPTLAVPLPNNSSSWGGIYQWPTKSMQRKGKQSNIT
jgi:hypothetical protein